MGGDPHSPRCRGWGSPWSGAARLRAARRSGGGGGVRPGGAGRRRAPPRPRRRLRALRAPRPQHGRGAAALSGGRRPASGGGPARRGGWGRGWGRPRRQAASLEERRAALSPGGSAAPEVTPARRRVPSPGRGRPRTAMGARPSLGLSPWQRGSPIPIPGSLRVDVPLSKAVWGCPLSPHRPLSHPQGGTGGVMALDPKPRRGDALPTGVHILGGGSTGGEPSSPGGCCPGSSPPSPRHRRSSFTPASCTSKEERKGTVCIALGLPANHGIWWTLFLPKHRKCSPPGMGS